MNCRFWFRHFWTDESSDTIVWPVYENGVQNCRTCFVVDSSCVPGITKILHILYQWSPTGGMHATSALLPTTATTSTQIQGGMQENLASKKYLLKQKIQIHVQNNNKFLSNIFSFFFIETGLSPSISLHRITITRCRMGVFWPPLDVYKRQTLERAK